ncbi:(2Fe-2S)-binding protein [Streptomyces sp. N2-109]|uniref:(2Fe-2S)-binding protein n=1 Tax=Streptomyces gossypii TaxID=2883101 RepID=A0ABT2JNB8_9ACTN|nr:(2Fe-2S)-binding protein [Streptomyces gossypii]
MACDELTDAVRHLGRVLEVPRTAADAAAALLPGGTPPFVGDAGFGPRSAADGQAADGQAGGGQASGGQAGGEPPRTRVGCCLYYTLRPAELCAGCPRAC